MAQSLVGVGLVIRCVTTTNKRGWEEFGHRMATAFVKYWPADIKLTVYAEGFEPKVDGIEVREMPPWLARFKERNGDQRWKHGHTAHGYDFRFDAVKFSHKVAALTDFSDPHKEGIDIWIDADTLTHSPVTEGWLNALHPEKSQYMAWLERTNSFPECGFVMYRTSHPYHGELMKKFRELYTQETLFTMPEYHDSFVLQQLVLAAVRANKMPHPASLSGDMGWSHPFVNGPLGSKMDHLKGPHRKTLGRSLPTDIRGRRSEDYWNKPR